MGQYTREEIEGLYLRLPVRHGRPVLVSDDSAATTIAADTSADERLKRDEGERALRTAVAALDQVIESMEDQDRLILKMRFWQALKVTDIAHRLHLDQKKVYKRLEQLLKTLRNKLEAMGVSGGEVSSLLGKWEFNRPTLLTRPATALT